MAMGLLMISDFAERNAPHRAGRFSYTESNAIGNAVGLQGLRFCNSLL